LQKVGEASDEEVRAGRPFFLVGSVGYLTYARQTLTTNTKIFGHTPLEQDQ